MRWLLALVIGLPWLVIPPGHDPFLLPKMMGWWVGTVGVLLSGLWLPARAFKNPWLSWLVMLVTLEMAARFWLTLIGWNAGDPNIPFLWFCVLPSIYVVLGGLFVVVCATRLLPSVAHRVRLTQVLCWTALSVAIYAILQRFDLDQFLQGTRIIGLNVAWEYRQDPARFMIAALGNCQYTAMYLSLTLPLFLLFQQRRYLGYLAVVLACILLTGRRFAIFLSAFSLVSYGWLRLWWSSSQKWKPLAFLLLVGSGLLVSLWSCWPMVARDERWLIWRSVWEQWRRQSMTGLGIGAFPLNYFVNWEAMHGQLPQLAPGSRWAWAHNDLLQWLMETGLFGMTALAACIGSTLRRAWPRTRTAMGAGYYACFLTLLASSLFYFPWHFAPTACVGLVIWSMCETSEGLT